MDKLKCYISEEGPSRHNMVLYFGYLTVPPLYFVATILAYFDAELGLIGVALNFIVILIIEWLVRTFLVKQRPGFICLEDNKLTLWYMAGVIRIEYPRSRYEVLSINNDDVLRLKIKKRLLPLSIKMKDYLLIYELPSTFDFFKIKLKEI